MDYMGQITKELPYSEHFEIQELADGIYAALASESGGAYCNAGIVDLGDRTLVVDTFDTIQAAEDLFKAVQVLTSRLASFVAITHAHPDHWSGNQVFADTATIISTHKSHKAMVEIKRDFEDEMREGDIKIYLEERLGGLKEQLSFETNDRKRALVESAISKVEHELKTLDDAVFTPGDQTFEGRLVFHGSKRTAELIDMNYGHTPSDCILILPEDKVVFLGDLGFFQCHPFLASSDPEAWLKRLEEILTLNIDVLVPGHGPLGNLEDIALQKQYIEKLIELVKTSIAEEFPVDDVIKQSIPAPFNELWVDLTRFETNIRSLYEWYSEEGD
jgi:glyoxylase-like metal-dependent hydrolase (beta-lactamase superfamily II)